MEAKAINLAPFTSEDLDALHVEFSSIFIPINPFSAPLQNLDEFFTDFIDFCKSI